MRFSQIFILGNNQHSAGKEIFRLVRVMCNEAGLHLIPLANINKLPTRKIRIKPHQEVDTGAACLITPDEIG